MKKLLLPLLLLSSFSALGGNENINDTLKQLNNNRLASLVKASLAVVGGCVAAKDGFYTLVGEGDGTDYFGRSFSRSIREGGWDNIKTATHHGVRGFGMLYVAYQLFKYALNRGQHALGK
jgi:hypothetical protein